MNCIIKRSAMILVLGLTPLVLAAQNPGTSPDASPGQGSTAPQTQAQTAPNQAQSQDQQNQQPSANPHGQQQAQPATPSTGGSTTTSATAQSGAIRVLSPKVGEKLDSTMVTVNYEVTNPGMSAAGSPTFRLQLDGRDPVETVDTTYSFTGLTVGKHVLSIEMVDANHTPISGSHTEVHFATVAPGGSQQGASPTSSVAPVVKPAALPLPQENANDEHLPSAGGELPLLSVIGFGVLVGGVASAMKTRK